MGDDMYLRKDIINPTNKNINLWSKNLSDTEKYIITTIRTNVKNDLKNHQIYVPTVIQPVENINSGAWGDYGWDTVAEDSSIPEGAEFIIFELRLVIENNTIKPFMKDGLYIQHSLQKDKSKKVVNDVFKKYFNKIYVWDMTNKRAILLKNDC